MVSKAYLPKDLTQAKQALRDRASSFEPLQVVKDNPVKSVGTAFLVGYLLSGTSKQTIPNGLLPMLLRASSGFISVID
jgi:hypothetical protein